MSVPIATTTVTVRGVRPQSGVDPDADGYDGPAPDPTDLATGIRATITLPVGRRSNPSDLIQSYVLRCDELPGDIELSQYDVVIDDSDGLIYRVQEVSLSKPVDFGLRHWVATLSLHKGIVSGEEFNEFTRD